MKLISLNSLILGMFVLSLLVTFAINNTVLAMPSDSVIITDTVNVLAVDANKAKWTLTVSGWELCLPRVDNSDLICFELPKTNRI